MIQHIPFVVMILAAIFDFWISIKFYKASNFIEWQKSMQDIDQVISDRASINRAKINKYTEILKLNRMVLAIACLTYFIQII